MVDLVNMHDYDNLLYKIARRLAYFEIYGEFLVEDELDNKPHATSIWGSSNRSGCFLPAQQAMLRNISEAGYEGNIPSEMKRREIAGLLSSSDSSGKNFDSIPNTGGFRNNSFREEDDEGYYELMDAFRPPAPRPGYVCNICRIPGHFIQYCPQAPTKTKTPYQGNKQCIGLFICNKCKRQWKSNKSFAEAGQECKKCHVIINPKKQFPLYTPPRKSRAGSFAYGAGGDAAGENFSPSPPLSSSSDVNRNCISTSATSSSPLRMQSLALGDYRCRNVRFDSVMTTTASLASDVFCDSALATPSPSPFGAYEFVFDC